MIIVLLSTTVLSQIVLFVLAHTIRRQFLSVIGFGQTAVIFILPAVLFIGFAYVKIIPIIYRAAVILIYPFIMTVTVCCCCSIGEWFCCTLLAILICANTCRDNRILLWGYTLLLVAGAVILGFGKFDYPLEPSQLMERIAFNAFLSIVICLELFYWNRSALRHNIVLEKQRAIAESAARMKGDFLANMNHEIRTPMNAILGFCSFLSQAKLNPTEQEHITNLKTASQTLLSIVNDILDLSKVEAGKFDIIPIQYDLMSLVNDIVSVLSIRFKNLTVRFFVEINPLLPQVLVGDEIRLRQVINNLVSNAIKFTKTGYVRLSLDGVASNDKLLLYVHIQDTGSGIKMTDLPKLFNVFQQVNTKSNRTNEGTGLGLSISKRFITLMNGTMFVETAWGEGSTFSFVVPQEFGTMRTPLIPIDNTEHHTDDTIGRSVDRQELSVALLETDPYRAEQWERMLTMMKLNYKIASSPLEFHSFCRSRLFTHYFIAEELYDKMAVDLATVDINLTVVVNYHFRGHTNFSAAYIRRPIHCCNLWNVLQGSPQTVNTAEEKTKFTMPDAKILIVDDNAMNLKIAAGLLKQYKCQLTCVLSGVAAIKEVQSAFYDLIMMDHMMPEMDGVEATNRIRSIGGEYYTTVPIIAVTANVLSSSMDMFLANGFTGFLAKPIEPVHLEKILLNHIPTNKKLSTVYDGSETAEADNREDYSRSGKLLSLPSGQVDLLDTVIGLQYTGGSEKIYLELLRDFTSSAKTDISKIRSLYKKKDWQNFIITTHTVKSIAKTLGALPLSEMNLDMERAGKDGNEAFIAGHMSAYLSLYAETVQQIQNYLDKGA